MPVIVQVTEDNAVQYSPNQSTYYMLYPKFDKTFQVDENVYQAQAIDPNEKVILKSKGIHHCHTVIVKDYNYNNYFMLHVSPQALRRPYDPVRKVAGTTEGFGGFGMFSLGWDEAITNSKKPAYIDLDPYYYDNGMLGTHPDSELEIIIVVNNEHWNAEKAKEEILGKLQNRIPGKVVKLNVIVNSALEHAYYYSVEFDPKAESLTVVSNNGLYTEAYDNAFDNNIHQHAHEMLPQEKRMGLQEKIHDLQKQSQEIVTVILATLDPYKSVEQLVLNPSIRFIELCSNKKIEIEALINGIESVLAESKNPVINLGSPNLYDSYKELGWLHLLTGNHEKCALYFSKAADYAINMRKAEFDDDMKLYSILAGAVYERNRDLEKAYYYYNTADRGNIHLDYIDAQLRCARIASQIHGKAVKALEAVLNARETLLKLIDQVEKHSLPQKEKILQALNSRGVMCHDLLDSLQEYLIEHRHESPVLQQEYDRNFAISTCIM